MTQACPPIRTVVVVDDDAAIVRLAASALREHGYQVLEAHSAEEAIRLTGIGSMPVDLLLTDVEMPEMDGFALWRSLRRRQAGVKVVFMTGGPRTDSEAVFLLKPFSVGELVRTVQGTLQCAGAR